MRRIAITNQKGGSGKTTTAVNLAAALAEQGDRVLLLDLDPQASATAWLGVRDGGRALLEVFTASTPLQDIVVSTDIERLDLLPSSTWLAQLDKALAGEVGAEMLLRQAVDQLEERWDWLLIDCPPAFGLLTVTALVACEEVLVPVEASTMALAGLASLVQTLERVRDRLNPTLHLGAILACRVDARTNLSREVVERLRERFGPMVLKTVIRENVRLREAPSFMQPITVYDSRSAGAEDYRAVAAELSLIPAAGRTSDVQ